MIAWVLRDVNYINGGTEEHKGRSEKGGEQEGYGQWWTILGDDDEGLVLY